MNNEQIIEKAEAKAKELYPLEAASIKDHTGRISTLRQQEAFIACAQWIAGEILQLQKDNLAQAETLKRTAEKCDRYREEVASLEQAVDEWIERDGKADEEITSLKQQNRELVLQLRRLQSYCLHYVKAYEKTQRCREVEQTLNKYDHTVIPES